MRKILYSPGFGAGWTTWHGGSAVQLKFMLEYSGFVEAVQQPGPDEPPKKRVKRAEEAASKALLDHRRTTPGWDTAPETLQSARDSEWDRIPIAILEAIPAFIAEWQNKFPGSDLPYMGGLHSLQIYEVDADDLVKIDEYDGSESVRVQGKEDGWL